MTSVADRSAASRAIRARELFGRDCASGLVSELVGCRWLFFRSEHEHAQRDDPPDPEKKREDQRPRVDDCHRLRVGIGETIGRRTGRRLAATNVHAVSGTVLTRMFSARSEELESPTF